MSLTKDQLFFCQKHFRKEIIEGSRSLQEAVFNKMSLGPVITGYVNRMTPEEKAHFISKAISSDGMVIDQTVEMFNKNEVDSIYYCFQVNAAIVNQGVLELRQLFAAYVYSLRQAEKQDQAFDSDKSDFYFRAANDDRYCG